MSVANLYWPKDNTTSLFVHAASLPIENGKTARAFPVTLSANLANFVIVPSANKRSMEGSEASEEASSIADEDASIASDEESDDDQVDSDGNEGAHNLRSIVICLSEGNKLSRSGRSRRTRIGREFFTSSWQVILFRRFERDTNFASNRTNSRTDATIVVQHGHGAIKGG